MSQQLNGVFVGGQMGRAAKGRDRYGHITPNVEYQEGVRITHEKLANFLPFVRFEKHNEDYVAISKGKAVAIAYDPAAPEVGYVVPAGYRQLLAAFVSGSNEVGPQYGAMEVGLGIHNAAGALAAQDEYVLASMKANSWEISRCVGVAMYDFIHKLGIEDYNNPATYKFNNYLRQAAVGVLTRYMMEYPVEPLERKLHEMEDIVLSGAGPFGPFDLDHDTVLESTIRMKVNNDVIPSAQWTFADGSPDTVAVSAALQAELKDGDIIKFEYKWEGTVFNAPWAGIGAWRGAAKPGAKVVVDESSNFKMLDEALLDVGATPDQDSINGAIEASMEVVGTIWFYDLEFPKQALDRVTTGHDRRRQSPVINGATGEAMNLDRVSGSATEGLPNNIYKAGGGADTGRVIFNLVIQ